MVTSSRLLLNAVTHAQHDPFLRLHVGERKLRNFRIREINLSTFSCACSRSEGFTFLPPSFRIPLVPRFSSLLLLYRRLLLILLIFHHPNIISTPLLLLLLLLHANILRYKPYQLICDTCRLSLPPSEEDDTFTLLQRESRDCCAGLFQATDTPWARGIWKIEDHHPFQATSTNFRYCIRCCSLRIFIRVSQEYNT